MILAGRCLELAFCLPDAQGTWRLQADPEEKCFISFQRWLLHLAGFAGVLALAVILPMLVYHHVSEIVRSGRWDDDTAQILFGGFYTGFKREWFWFFVVQH